MSAEKIFRKLITAHQNPNDNSDEYNLGYVDAMKMAINQVTKESKQDKDWKRVGELANEITKIVRNETLPSKTMG